MSLLYAGQPCTKKQVRATIWMLRYYNGFLKSDCERCRNPESRWGDSMTKDQVRRRIGFLVNMAINRKAGIPDAVGRKQDPEYQNVLRRECREINEHFGHRRRLWGLNGRRFQNDIIQKRYGHLLDEGDDE